MTGDPVVWQAFLADAGPEYADRYLRQHLQWYGKESPAAAAGRWMDENEIEVCEVAVEGGQIVVRSPPEWAWRVIGRAERFVERVEEAAAVSSRRRATRSGPPAVGRDP